jgi:hypothetical protein
MVCPKLNIKNNNKTPIANTVDAVVNKNTPQTSPKLAQLIQAYRINRINNKTLIEQVVNINAQ